MLACCPVNITEVYAGLRPKEEASTEEFFASLQLLPLTEPAARMAGELKRNYSRRGVTLNLGDAIMAAVAIHNKITLLTDNVKGLSDDGSITLPAAKDLKNRWKRSHPYR